MINKQHIPLGIDIFFCMILIPVMMMLLPVEKWLVSNSLFVVILIAWLYSVYFCIKGKCLPMLFKDRKQATIAVAILLLTVLITWVITQYQMDYPFRGEHSKNFRARKNPYIIKTRLHQQATWFMYIVTLCFSISVGLLNELYKEIVARQTIEFEKKKAELALYKAQINPHFLFNTLNLLYGLIISKSQKAESTFLQFIGLMKYMYSKSAKDFVAIDEEIEYITQYIELQKNRIDENKTHVNFTYSVNESTEHMCIAPMILITFIENALKYGVSSHYESNVDICISVKGNVLELYTRNNIVNPRKKDKEKGIGISNCRKRLELLYPDRHNLDISIANDVYIVKLDIKLKQT